MSKLRTSNYLNIIPYKDTYLLFNGYNGSLDEVSNSLGMTLEESDNLEESLSQEEQNFLLRRGHIMGMSKEQEVDVFKSYVTKLDENDYKQSLDKGNLMIMMTYDCNLACDYCYQTGSRNAQDSGVITEEIIDQLFNQHYESLFADVDPRNLYVVLYGGEPLLARNRKAVERVLHYTKKYGLKAGTISNCTQVNHFFDICGPLPGQINFIQVSLDGDKMNHDQSRIGKFKEPTFDLILDHAHQLLDLGVEINMRINIDSNSIEQLDDLYQKLIEQEFVEHPNCYIYVHPLHNHLNQTDDSDFVSHIDTANRINELRHGELIRHPVRRKAEQLKYLFSSTRGTVVSKTRFCMQNYPNSYVIDPKGIIYGCYEEVGMEAYKIGELDQDKVEFYDMHEKYLSRSILKMDKCAECSIALVCGGECSVATRKETKDIFKAYCSQRKEETYEALKYLLQEYETLNQRKDEQQMLFPNL